MTPEELSERERQFHEHLLAVVTSAPPQIARFGTKGLLSRIKELGGVAAAREVLEPQEFDSGPVTVAGMRAALFGRYFRDLKRIGRLDLSVEAQVLGSRWSELFAKEEREVALRRLSEHNFNPPLESFGLTATTEAEKGAAPGPAASAEPWRSGLVPPPPRDTLAVDLVIRTLEGLYDCEGVHWLNGQLQAGVPAVAHEFDRNHLKTCHECRSNYPAIVEAYRQFDQERLQTWVRLLEAFKTTVDLGDEKVGSMVPMPAREDFEDEEEYESAQEQAEDELAEARQHFAWRAVRLAHYIGHYMTRYQRSHGQEANLWQRLRKQPFDDYVSSFVRDLDEELYTLALAAQHVYWVVALPEQQEVLRLPSEGDLTNIEGVMQVDEVEDLEEWQEVLGTPPQQFSSFNLIYVAWAAAQWAAAEGEKGQAGGGSGFEELAEDVKGVRERQDITIDLLERMVASLSATDRHTCEESLQTQIGPLYSRLRPTARQCLLASEHAFRTKGYPDPSVIVSETARAFERQMKLTILPDLFKHLRSQYIIPPNRPTLGKVAILFREHHEAVDEFCRRRGLDRQLLTEALEDVKGPRADALHEEPMLFQEAEDIRERWLGWRGQPGGVFAALFPAQ
mgnify:CR=1 FL=1